MKQSKSEITQRRQRLLIVIALILGLLAGCTGYFGFVYTPAEDNFSNTDPTAATDQTLPEDSFSLDPTQTGDAQGLPVQDVNPDLTQFENGQDLSADNSDSAPTQTGDAQTAPSEESESTPQPVASASQPTGDQMPVNRDMSGQAHSYVTKNSTPSIRPGNLLRLCMRIAFCIFLTALIADISLLLMLRKNIREHEERKPKKKDFIRPIKTISMPITRRKVEQPLQPIPGIFLGKVHDLGKREYQQDSFGQSPVLNGAGILAILADGMGGLSNGERVSQQIVMEALNFAAALQSDQIPSALPDMVEKVNRSVNQMLGPSGLYTSGSTLVSALIIKDALWWISVGDSRIYLYRDSRLNQLSRDHDLFQDWMPDILDGKRSLDEAMKNPEGRKLTSFIGMGELRYVDRNLSPIPLLPGDRILLMSDGIYGTVSDAEMTDILQNCANVQDAASQIAKKISTAALPYQDNYTLVILGYDSPSSPISNGT